jgi:hypothetical protein
MPLPIGAGTAAIVALFGRLMVWLMATYLGQWVLRIMITLGISFATVKISLPLLMSFVQNYVGGLPADLYQYFGAVGGDVVVTMIMSALMARGIGSVALRAATRA